MALRQSTGFRNLMAGINTELVPYGAMTTDVDTQAAWTESGSTMLGGVTYDSRVGVMSLVGAGYAADTITTKVGHMYKLTYYFANADTTGYASVRVGTAADGAQNYDSGNLSQATTWAAAGQVTIGFKATATTTYITLKCSGAGIKYFDSVSVSSLSHSWQDVFNGAKLHFYSGTQPTTPDDAQTSTLLCTVSNGGSGVTWKDAVSGATGKTVGETWSGVCVASGTVGWCRIQHPDDSLTDASTTIARVDATCGTSGADINFTGGLYFASGSTQTITDFVPTEPMSN